MDQPRPPSAQSRASNRSVRKTLHELISPKEADLPFDHDFIFQREAVPPEQPILTELDSSIISDGGEIDIQRQVHPLKGASFSQVFPTFGFLGKKKSNVVYKQNLQKFLKKDPAKSQIHDREKNMHTELTKRLEILKANDRKYKKVINKIHNSDSDPLRELGPGISTYH
jgi:hypothetical protein